ncbi:MAG TPA: hypothetical protein VKY27_12665 [Bacteriovoracaceae bacterium]|nr:hypothetical protein [Bacteriovoracaceae bacterium]
MRWLAGFLLLVALCLLGSYIFIKGYPYQLYSSWLNGKGWNKYYMISSYRSLYLLPKDIDPLEDYKEDFQQLWKPFPLRNTLVPFPVRHPLFRTVPIIQRFDSKSDPLIGMSILSAKGRELSNLYTVTARYLPDYSLGQELFKLPFVRNRILKYDQNQLWRDVYTRKIEVNSKDMDEMIYDLYIMYLRSEMLPPNAIKYGLIHDDIAVLEIESEDKDYRVEMINKLLNGQVYTYVLKTDLRNPESKKLRSKFLRSINFTHVDNSMGDILYKEFKQLSYHRQIDSEGMLYLFSAWSMDIKNENLMREMIFHLERGTQNDLQLIPLYQFAYSQFGTTFTTRKGGAESNPEIQLQRMIELERKEEREKAARKAVVTPDELENLSEEEKMMIRLRKAKEGGPLQTDDVIVH